MGTTILYSDKRGRLTTAGEVELHRLRSLDDSKDFGTECYTGLFGAMISQALVDAQRGSKLEVGNRGDNIYLMYRQKMAKAATAKAIKKARKELRESLAKFIALGQEAAQWLETPGVRELLESFRIDGGDWRAADRPPKYLGFR